jgi:hypothetical protein
MYRKYKPNVIRTTTPGSWEAPHVMPMDLIKIRPVAFIQDVLDPYRAHLSKHWSQQQIDDVEKEY